MAVVSESPRSTERTVSSSTATVVTLIPPPVPPGAAPTNISRIESSLDWSVRPGSDIVLKPKGFLLLDSGAQYADGTTDITRTIPLGPLTHEEKLVYTLVLKGHIDIQMLKFPDGASGTQLDVIARQALWKYGYNYLHGTGHGVGSYLSVHEGPHQIRMEYRPAPLHEGMTVTDEPGVYIEGKFGVRIENTLLIRKYLTPIEQSGATPSPTPCFLEFETLTLCPIDTEPILLDLLTPEEQKWLMEYNRKCEEIL